MDSGLIAPSFLPSDDLIASLNKAMAFISTAFTSRYPPTNNQLSTSSNPRNQATIQDGREIPTPTAFQTNDLDAFDSDCNEAPSASAVLMGLTKEVTDMRDVFNQMETEIAKCSKDRKTFEKKEKELLIENDRLLKLIISQDLVHIAVNTLATLADYKKWNNVM
ncbi:hypothetical protein Tco_0561188 [Tanacetum coccineum]